MHIISRLGTTQTRVSAFPAPICEPCFEPMKLNGEFTPTVDGRTAVRREYQCRMCGAVKRVMRTSESA
jgi:hypothetical protein